MASLALAMLAACSGTAPDNGEKEGVTTVLPEQKNEVTVMKLTRGDFHHELVSNGKVAAGTFADLCFRTSEVVAKVWVKNGSFVRKGQKLAELDLFALNNSLAQTRNALAQARLEMHDVLIGQGYQPDNLDAVPAEVLEWFSLVPVPLKTMDANRLSVRQFMRHPYLSFYQARDLVEYRKKHRSIQQIEELLSLESFSTADIERLRPYLIFR